LPKKRIKNKKKIIILAFKNGVGWIKLINALLGAVKRIAKNPLVLLPAFASIAIFFILVYIFSPFLIELVIEMMVLENFPETSLNALPFQLIELYGLNLAALLVFVILSGILFAALNYWYAAYEKLVLDGKPSLEKACGKTIHAIGQIISFTLFILIFAFLLAILLWFSLMATMFFELVGLVLLVLFALAGFYVVIKFVFVLQALAFGKNNVKKALEQSWNFSQGRFWQVLLFVIVVTVIYGIITSVGTMVSELFEGEIESMIIFAVFWAVFLAFSGLALASYYSKKAK